jgi:Na+-translocating ferredoxin:NAD+ oxidoreductase RnfC subunit
MRSLGFTATGSKMWNEFALLCCGCGICTLYACPEGLYPREACLGGIADRRAQGKASWEGRREVKVHPMKEYRRVPMRLLNRRLGIDDYEAEAPFRDLNPSPSSVRIPLKQHVGEPARPLVSVGDRVSPGQLIGEIPEGKLGARVHASIPGRVTGVSGFVEIERI